MVRGSSKPTLVSLARELGVSRQTVSNVINAPELVKPETRARVQAAIDRAGYRPSALGRALRTNRSMNLALRVRPSPDDLAGHMLDRFLHALADAARDTGYRVTIFAVADDSDEVEEVTGLHAVHAIDGCVLTDTTPGDERPARLAGLGVPFVAFGRPWGAEPGRHAWVDVDCAAGLAAATRHLIGRGHTRIGFLGWDDAGPGTGADRRRGWRDAVAPVLPDPDALAIATSDGVRHGRAGAAELRDRGATAVVCASDSLALGAHAELAGRPGPALPIVGVDDTAVARALGISSLAQPVEDAARFCVQTLAALLATDADPAGFQRLLQPTLRLR